MGRGSVAAELFICTVCTEIEKRGREGGGREESEVEGRVAEKIGAGFTHMCWMLAFDTVDRLASVASKTFLHNIVERPCMYCIHVPVAICSS